MGHTNLLEAGFERGYFNTFEHIEGLKVTVIGLVSGKEAGIK